ERGERLLVLDARDRAGLARHAREVAHTIEADGLSVARVADTLARRTPLTERLAVVAQDAATAADALLSAAAALE
ncbi:EmrA/EmrK family multidrug efflux transporter periplasmic adaptor subunit, partial [Streptomyces sp. SID10692]|nr:EmrA/EmrK family multidrug efflux transporter periplasmic adaptor subunit [Streptomyces sp. SID10692]